jgi:hypothetical protein
MMLIWLRQPGERVVLGVRRGAEVLSFAVVLGTPDL